MMKRFEILNIKAMPDFKINSCKLFLGKLILLGLRNKHF